MTETAERRAAHLPVLTAALIGAVASMSVRYGVWRRELPLVIAYRLGFTGRGLLAGRWWTVATSQLLTRDAFMTASIIASLAIMLGGYEFLAGTRRAAVVAVSGVVIGPTVVAGVLAVASGVHWEFAARTLSTLDYGASAVTAAAGGALVAATGHRRLRQFAVVFVLGGLVLHHQLADWEHVVAFPTGYGLARLMHPRRTVELSASTVTRAARRRVLWFARPAGVLAAIGVGAVTIGFAPPVAAVPARASGGLRVLDTFYPSPSVGGTRRVLVVLPDGASGRRFPVLEILHGRPGQPNDALTGLDLLRSAAATSAILVMPDGHGPVVSDGDFADTSRQRLGAALSDDLRRWVDATFPTDGRWAVAGYSAGGYGAAYLASRDVASYQLVCPISGYFTARDPAFAGESPAVRDAASPVLHADAAGPRVVLIVGTSDPEAQRETMAYADALARAHQPYELVQLSGGHSASVWRPGVERCLQALAGLPSPPGSR